MPRVRLCEPCTVVDGYASWGILRPLVHRGGLRVDVLAGGQLHLGDEITALGCGSRSRTDAWWPDLQP
jgi:hypothetical protein